MPTSVHAARIRGIRSEEAFSRLCTGPGVFWLDSSLRTDDEGRYSIMGFGPRWVFTAKNDRWVLNRTSEPDEAGETGALPKLEALLKSSEVTVPTEAPDLPFWGGAVGWLSYDLGRAFERIEGTACDDLGHPDIRLAWHDAALVWDHLEQVVWCAGTAEGRRALEERIAIVAGPSASAQSPHPVRVARTMSRDDYCERVDAVREGIARGEYYQLNLVQRFSCPHRQPAPATYDRLRALNPAPFSAYIAAGDTVVLSSSPERFLEVTPDGRVRTCPIKGTRPRGRTPAEDHDRRAELLESTKERAELLMIVDLMRNDLGRVCAAGSVNVARLHDVESFATVHHLVGEVQGKLRQDVGLEGLLRAVFPGGSITGAPKVSAMAAIDRLEPTRRGIAMGALGYFSAHGRSELAIAIRTIVIRSGMAHVSVGAGIVWDSDALAEYEETLVKARALLCALGVDDVEAQSSPGGDDHSDSKQHDPEG